MSLPRRPALKKAWHAYVLGHDLGVAREVKAAWGESSAAETVAADGAVPAPADGAAPAPAPGRVSVPDRLDFHRGPDTWREREGG
ncbi:MAG: hypothetical protein ACE5HQ_06600 [Gemmatimonadota bacterium]